MATPLRSYLPSLTPSPPSSLSLVQATSISLPLDSTGISPLSTLPPPLVPHRPRPHSSWSAFLKMRIKVCISPRGKASSALELQWLCKRWPWQPLQPPSLLLPSHSTLTTPSLPSAPLTASAHSCLCLCLECSFLRSPPGRLFPSPGSCAGRPSLGPWSITYFLHGLASKWNYFISLLFKLSLPHHDASPPREGPGAADSSQ